MFWGVSENSGLQCNSLNGSAVEPAKNWTNKRIETLSDSDLLRDCNKMGLGLARSWTVNRIDPLSGDPLSGLECIDNHFFNSSFQCGCARCARACPCWLRRWLWLCAGASLPAWRPSSAASSPPSAASSPPSPASTTSSSSPWGSCWVSISAESILALENRESIHFGYFQDMLRE